MSEVIPFGRSTPPPEPPPRPPALKDHFGDDDWILQMCAEWRVARAQMQQNWAVHEFQCGWGYLPDKDIELDSKPLDTMQRHEYPLAMCKPGTVLLARELLRMCV